MQNRLFGRCLALVLALCSLLPSVALARDELKNTDPEKYYIELDTRNQVVTVYEKDDQGEYTRVVRRMLCTSGKTEPDGLEPASPTPAAAGRSAPGNGLGNLPPLMRNTPAIGPRW